MQKVKFNKKIIMILLLCMTLLCASVGITFSYFSDRKESSITLEIGRLNDTAITAADTISSANLVSGNTFTKSVTVTNKANFSYYIRVWAEVETQVYENNTKTTKTNLVSVTGVKYGTTALTSNSGKYVYTTAIPTTTSSFVLTFTFKVSDSFTEELNYRTVDGNWVLDNTLTTKITYKAEIIQSEAGYNNWA